MLLPCYSVDRIKVPITNEGEAVILHPGDQIHEGVRVKPF
jgi:hypothetical protein